jgi:hypothetical protein
MLMMAKRKRRHWLYCFFHRGHCFQGARHCRDCGKHRKRGRYRNIRRKERCTT